MNALFKLKPEVKAKWVAALTSGEYQQTTGVLQQGEYDPGTNRNKGHCCLGVLCDLYEKENNLVDGWQPGIRGTLKYGDESYVPPENVLEWAFDVPPEAMSQIVNPAYKLTTVSDIHGKTQPLDIRNDEGASFAEIAALIDEKF